MDKGRVGGGVYIQGVDGRTVGEERCVLIWASGGVVIS